VSVRVRDWATVDFYAVLGVEPTATGDEIALAFRALAKQLHPDRVGATDAEAERFKSVTAAYEVLGNERVRRDYDNVRITVVAPAPTNGNVATAARPVTVVPPTRAPVAPEVARRRARRWIVAGIAVTIVGLVVAALIVHLKVAEHDRRAGRIKTDATVIVGATHNDLRFATADGTVVRVAEPERVNPGTRHDGQSVAILYRPERPTDVLLVESTVARDITLWFVALKMLVGGPIFLAVGIRRLRKAQTGGGGMPKVGAA
jgi:hypothetical protein